MQNVRIINLGNNTLRGYFSFIIQAIRGLSSYYNTSTPIYIDFTNNNKFTEEGGDNIFEYIFKQPFLKKNELCNYNMIENAVWISGDLFSQNIRLSSDDYFVGRRVFNDFIKIKPEILKEFNEIFKNYEKYKILGIHRRGSDHNLHSQILDINYVINTVDEYEKDYDKVFLATEEECTLDVFKKRYKDKLIFLPAKRAGLGIPVFKNLHNFSKIELVKEVFFDAYFLSKCDFLLKTVSNVSDFSVMANNNINYIEIDKHINVK